MSLLKLFLIFLLTTSCSTLSELKQLTDTVSSASSSNPYKDQIINGTSISKDSDYGRRTILLVMGKPTEKMSVCTAVPIGLNLLLTAAHCVYNRPIDELKVVFTDDFSHKNMNQNIYVAVEKYKVHDLYDGTAQSYSDLALLKLKSSIPADYKVVPTYDGKKMIIDDQLVLTGYGITDENKKDSLVLRMTTKSYKRDVYIKNSLIGFNQKNITGGFCKGDSGAPIFVREKNTIKLIGINSFTAGSGDSLDCRTASFAMYIPHFRNWIISESIKL